jgi:phosphate transport system substrate-binding protein
VTARALAAAAVLALTAPGTAHGAAKAPEIHISGSNTALPLVADLAFFYRRSVKEPPRFSIVGGGTQAGVVDAARGISDIGMASRGKDPSDPAGAVFTTFARSALCLVTNKENPVPGLDHGQIQSLVGGEATTWPQIAGSPRSDTIIGAGLGPGTGEYSSFLRLFVDLATPVKFVQRTLASSRQVRQYIEGTPYAWGYVDFAFTSGLHVVPYQGIPCARPQILDGTYPGTFDVSYVTRGTAKGAVKRFIDWTRTSRAARRVIATRYVPVK